MTSTAVLTVQPKTLQLAQTALPKPKHAQTAKTAKNVPIVLANQPDRQS
jgi:hypothetical protein